MSGLPEMDIRPGSEQLFNLVGQMLMDLCSAVVKHPIQSKSNIKRKAAILNKRIICEVEARMSMSVPMNTFVHVDVLRTQ